MGHNHFDAIKTRIHALCSEEEAQKLVPHSLFACAADITPPPLPPPGRPATLQRSSSPVEGTCTSSTVLVLPVHCWQLNRQAVLLLLS